MENTNLSKTYNPKDFEARLYKKWMDEGYFKSKPNPDKKTIYNNDATTKYNRAIAYGTRS